MNEKPGFTKGPWFAHDDPEFDQVTIRLAEDDHWGHVEIAEVTGSESDRIANAHLIAAGPDLYEAFAGDDREMPECIRPISWLHSLIQYCNARGPTPDDADPGAFWDMMGEVEALYEKGMAAIAKAEGRS